MPDRQHRRACQPRAARPRCRPVRGPAGPRPRSRYIRGDSQAVGKDRPGPNCISMRRPRRTSLAGSGRLQARSDVQAVPSVIAVIAKTSCASSSSSNAGRSAPRSCPRRPRRRACPSRSSTRSELILVGETRDDLPAAGELLGDQARAMSGPRRSHGGATPENGPARAGPIECPPLKVVALSRAVTGSKSPRPRNRLRRRWSFVYVP